eukprot:scaffold17471_cov115-Isochrysis_galbana.AAC.3
MSLRWVCSPCAGATASARRLSSTVTLLDEAVVFAIFCAHVELRADLHPDPIVRSADDDLDLPIALCPSE